jgi:hypothetical protein
VDGVTLEQVEKRKQKGADFARNVLQDDSLADDLEDESAESYAERKHLKISNSAGRRQAVMANDGNGGNGDDDYDFSGWSKQDCVDTLTQVAQIADDAYDPRSSREDMAQALSDILDALGEDDNGGDGDDEVADDDDGR